MYPNSITIRRKHHVLRWNLIFFIKLFLQVFYWTNKPLPASLFYKCRKKTVKKYQFSKSMCDISSIAKCKQKYTAYCIRGTLRGRVELDHIMFMSEHRKEGSIDSYAGKWTGNQKIAISKTFFSLASASNGGAGHWPYICFVIEKWI